MQSPIGLFLRVGFDGIGWDAYEEHFWEHCLLRFEYAYVGLPGLEGPCRGSFAAAAFSRDGKSLALGSSASIVEGVKTDGEIQLWRVRDVLPPK